MEKYKLKLSKNIENKVVKAYKDIENGVVGTYKGIENGVVGTYKKIEDKFVDTFLEPVDSEYHDLKSQHDNIKDIVNKTDKK